MARELVRASNQFLSATAVYVTTSLRPASAMLFGLPNNLTDHLVALAIGIANSANNYTSLAFAGSTASDPVMCQASSSGIDQPCSTSAGYSEDVWQTGAWTANGTGNGRAVYLNGGSRGTTTGSALPSSIDTTYVGRFTQNASPNHFDGRIGEVGIWEVELTERICSATKWAEPPLVALNGLKAWFPLVNGDFNTRVRGTALTNSSTTDARHCPVFKRHNGAGGVGA